MFTGIITEVGRVRTATRATAGLVLEIECAYPALVLGESIAVEGVCLTVTRVTAGGFTADVSAESLARSTLGALAPGARVNLERALAASDRLGGHIVAGHVDGVGRVLARTPAGDAERWSIALPPDLARYVAEKGSIAVDGVSLTVNAVSAADFEVMLIPFTRRATTLEGKPAGTPVNLEVDVLARYVARMLEVRGAGGTGGVTMDLLARAGYLKP
jgi:riboflavin synthase